MRASCVEAFAINITLDRLEENFPSHCRDRNIQFAPVALRMELLGHLLGMPSFREFSAKLASKHPDLLETSWNNYRAEPALDRAYPLALTASWSSCPNS
ncbi:MAG: hypothetical protein MK080_10415 [Opitutales bacterium]|nr:hypothetical protein [Opitutales bacterium]NRA28133.1 hypothetical protein [Opitutales bacterium]